MSCKLTNRISLAHLQQPEANERIRQLSEVASRASLHPLFQLSNELLITEQTTAI